MAENITYHKNVETVALFGPIEDVTRYARTTRVEHHSPIEKVDSDKGPNFGKRGLTSSDSVTVQELFSTIATLSKESTDQLQVKEIFTSAIATVLQDAEADKVTVSELFTEEFIAAIRKNTSDQVQVGEIFVDEILYAVRHNVTDEVTVGEIFVANLIQTLFDTAQDEVSVHELFSSEFIAAIRDSTIDQVQVQELFSVTLPDQFIINTNDNAVVGEIFTSRLAAAIQDSTIDQVSLSEIFTTDFNGFTAPSNLVANHTYTGGNSLTWSYGGGNPDYFELQYEVNNNNIWNLEAPSIPGEDRTYIHQGCSFSYSNSDTVRYRLRSVSFNGNQSDWSYSNSVTITNC